MKKCQICGEQIPGGAVVSQECLNRLLRDRADLRNELCLKCGKGIWAHKGACDGCRWKEELK